VAPEGRPPRGLALRLAVVGLVTVGCLAAVLYGLDLEAALSAVAGFRAVVLVPMALLYLGAHGLRSVRLGLLLKDDNEPSVPFRRLFSVNAIGFLAINLVPLRLGEMVRPWLLAEREGVAVGRGVAAIVLERMLDFVVLLGMLLALGLLVELPAEGIVVAGVDVLEAGQRALGGLLLVGCLGGVVVVVLGKPAVALIRRLPLGPRLAGFALQFRAAFTGLLQAPARAVAALALSVAIWGCTVAAVGVVMTGFSGLPASPLTAFVTWTITLTGMVAVPTPGFFGPYELFCAAALWLWEVPADLAAAFALTLHLGQLGFTVLLGGTALSLAGLGLRDLVRPAPGG
jgi:hypothetical protein